MGARLEPERPEDTAGGIDERPRDVRPDDRAGVRERGVGDGQLKRRDLKPALPDGEVDRVALVPGRVPAGEARLEPGRGGHDAAGLAREVEPGRVAEPEGL